MPGPLPEHTKRRRNAPTVPTTALPAGGYSGDIPDPPETYDLGASGRAWWAWAWRTPQASGWSDGDLYVLARRALLEDDIKAIGAADWSVDLDGLSESGEAEVRAVLNTLKGLVTGRLSILKEARDLDDRLGLTPKGLAALRWKIVPDAAAPATSGSPSSPPGRTYGHLRSTG